MELISNQPSDDFPTEIISVPRGVEDKYGNKHIFY